MTDNLLTRADIDKLISTYREGYEPGRTLRELLEALEQVRTSVWFRDDDGDMHVTLSGSLWNAIKRLVVAQPPDPREWRMKFEEVGWKVYAGETKVLDGPFFQETAQAIVDVHNASLKESNGKDI